VIALRVLLFRIETKRILKAHLMQDEASAGEQAPTEHQHDD